MNKNIFYIALFGIILILSNSFFIVQQRTQALVFQFGEVVRTVKEPGLSFKIPFLQSVEFFDLRLLITSGDIKAILLCFDGPGKNISPRLFLELFVFFMISCDFQQIFFLLL